MIEPGVSIVLCCYNGSDRLHKTIHHIANQLVPPQIPWEFILIDNASTDNSAEVARLQWDSYHLSTPFRIIAEPIAGLTHARAKGFESARYDVVIMCDDDNWLAQDYVALAYSIMIDKPNIGALGGLGTLVYEFTPPDWIANSYIFAAGPQGTPTGKARDYKLYGAGCVVRKSSYFVLKDIGYKSLLTDRIGINLSSGGDYELCYALVIAGYDLRYDERLQFKHFITRERLTWEYFIRYAKESSKCFDVLEAYKFVIVHEISNFFIVWLKNTFYCLRFFLRINAKRLFLKSDSMWGRMLYFKHVEFKYKLKVLFRETRKMYGYHSHVLAFKRKTDTLLAAMPKLE